MKRLRSGLDVSDVVVLLGVILTSVGAGLIWWPVGLIVAGVLLLALGLWGM